MICLSIAEAQQHFFILLLTVVFFLEIHSKMQFNTCTINCT